MQAPAVPAGNDSGAAIGEDSGGLSLVRPGTDETFRDARGLVPVQVELERDREGLQERGDAVTPLGPDLGAHTAEVLAELGVDEARLADLRASEVVR